MLTKELSNDRLTTYAIKIEFDVSSKGSSSRIGLRAKDIFQGQDSRFILTSWGCHPPYCSTLCTRYTTCECLCFIHATFLFVCFVNDIVGLHCTLVHAGNGCALYISMYLCIDLRNIFKLVTC